MLSGLILDHLINSFLHCITDMLLVARKTTPFFMVQAAVTPTRGLPAPQGKTMMPLLTRPLPNILLRLFSWYGRI